MESLLTSLKSKALMPLRLLIVVTCVFNCNVSNGQNSSSQLKVEQLGERYIYTIGDMCSIFTKSFASAKPFLADNLAIVCERHKSGLFIGKETDESGYAIYDK